MALKKRITPLVESGKNQQLELLDVSPEEQTTKSPESLPPIGTSDKMKSRMYQCKRNFGMFLMGILMFSSHLKKFISVTLASCFYHQSLLVLIAISMLFEALISIIALVMIFYNVNNRQSVKANVFNNILLYCVLIVVILELSIVANNSVIVEKTNPSQNWKPYLCAMNKESYDH